MTFERIMIRRKAWAARVRGRNHAGRSLGHFLRKCDVRLFDVKFSESLCDMPKLIRCSLDGDSPRIVWLHARARHDRLG